MNSVGGKTIVNIPNSVGLKHWQVAGFFFGGGGLAIHILTYSTPVNYRFCRSVRCIDETVGIFINVRLI